MSRSTLLVAAAPAALLVLGCAYDAASAEGAPRRIDVAAAPKAPPSAGAEEGPARTLTVTKTMIAGDHGGQGEEIVVLNSAGAKIEIRDGDVFIDGEKLDPAAKLASGQDGKRIRVTRMGAGPHHGGVFIREGATVEVRDGAVWIDGEKIAETGETGRGAVTLAKSAGGEKKIVVIDEKRLAIEGDRLAAARHDKPGHREVIEKELKDGRKVTIVRDLKAHCEAEDCPHHDGVEKRVELKELNGLAGLKGPHHAGLPHDAHVVVVEGKGKTIEIRNGQVLVDGKLVESKAFDWDDAGDGKTIVHADGDKVVIMRRSPHAPDAPEPPEPPKPPKALEAPPAPPAPK